MLTASHNPIEDNGIKLTEHDGKHLLKEFESDLI